MTIKFCLHLLTVNHRLPSRAALSIVLLPTAFRCIANHPTQPGKQSQLDTIKNSATHAAFA